MTWSREFVGLVNEIERKIGVERLYFEDEISGLSGARTFRARTDMAAGTGHRVILKIGKPGQIEDERQRYNQARNYFGTHPALHDFGGESGSHSWLAMSVALDGLGKTLRDRFDDLSAQEIETVIDQLIRRAIRLYEKSSSTRSLSAFGQYVLHPDIIPNLRDIGDVSYTLVDWWEHAAASDVQLSTEAFIHGDLHGGNVLLAGRGKSIQVSLIDFGLSGAGHAYRDLAKLERDLCLFVESAQDDSISKRLSAIDNQLEGEHPTNVPEHGSVEPDVERAIRAIRQIRELAEGFARRADGDRWRHEYDVALTAQFMFTAANPKVSDAKRRAALDRAYILRDGLIERIPLLKPPVDKVRGRDLEDQAWKVAYSLLRLDQLPRGGWSRFLPQWMELIWEGEHGTVFRSPAMKDNGGDDSAGYAVHLLSQFTSWVGFNRLDPNHGIGHALQACAIALEKRVGTHGGLDEGRTSRGEPPPIKVRHTIVGLLVHLNCERFNVQGFQAGIDYEVVKYLLEVIPRWKDDKSHLFGMYASAVALWRVLSERPSDALLSDWSALRDCLDTCLPDMATCLRNVRYKPKPETTYAGPLAGGYTSASFFIPYYDLWRMERSNALMFLPLLLDESGSQFSRKGELGHLVKRRIGANLAQLVEGIRDTTDLSEGLIRYHESTGQTEAARDWGLSAELLRLLEMPAIQTLLKDAGVQERVLDHKRSILRRALRETLADYGKFHNVFRYSHGLSVGAYLSEQVARRISPQQVEVLDEQINKARAEFCSEQTLHRLAQCILTGSLVTEREDEKDKSPPEAKMLTELFVSKLAAGDHRKLTDDHFPREHWTEGSYKSTISYFNQPSSKPNPVIRSGIHDTLFLRLSHVCGPFKGKNLRAVDLGCGHGMAAKWLMEQGFDVTLVDGSEEMRERAKQTLKDVADDKFVLGDVRELRKFFSRNMNTFDLVIANALFVHIAPRDAAKLMSKVYDILKPGGHFFFNVKIRDHTLVSLDGRYFAYYPNFKMPRSMLRVAGFEVDEVALRENHQTCYDVPKDIHWANFYCRKPE